MQAISTKRSALFSPIHSIPDVAMCKHVFAKSSITQRWRGKGRKGKTYKTSRCNMHLVYPQKDCSSLSTHLYHILYHFHWFFQPIHRNDPKLGSPYVLQWKLFNSSPDTCTQTETTALRWLLAF